MVKCVNIFGQVLYRLHHFLCVNFFTAELVKNPNMKSLEQLQHCCDTSDVTTLESLQVGFRIWIKRTAPLVAGVNHFRMLIIPNCSG